MLGFCKHHSKKKMEKPNYVLRTNEAVLMPVNQGNGLLVFKICVWIVVALTVLGSIVFQDNLFSELSFSDYFSDRCHALWRKKRIFPIPHGTSVF